LSLVRIFIAKEAVSFDSLARNARDRRHLQRRMSRRLASLVAEEIVTRRNIEMRNFESLHGSG